jgi:hypothetical protein
MVGARDRPETIKRKSKKEKGKAPMELELAPPSGKKSKRAHYTKFQMVMDALVKVVELSLKVGYTPFQKLLKFTRVIPKEEEKVAMGMDTPTTQITMKRKALMKRNLFMRRGHQN